ncbi:phage minor capsid protein [uncultured Ruminococcus sp.]|uniref:phage minor capsid protein n=1 Tax=uncultured Ruminococcus sp. TaxID=165186 RepID=UPI00349FBE77
MPRPKGAHFNPLSPYGGRRSPCQSAILASSFQSTPSTQELTAHSGARPEHARWQGQLVTLTGETIDGLHVYTLHEIGYGSGEGFKGWNCHHDWHAYYKGISKPNYTPEQIKKLNEKNISYNGKKYTKYEISQMQRQGERNVRALKRRTLASQAAVENAPDEETKAVLQADYVANAVKLKESEKQLKTFCSQTGQRRDTFREQVNGFGRSTAQRSVQAAKTDLTHRDYNDIIHMKGKMSDRDARLWYVAHDKNIPDLIDRTKPIEDQARQACDLRNQYRYQARELMADQEKRKKLDITDPIKSFDELMQHKMEDKGLSYEKALEDIVKTATKTRKSVNDELGVEG